MGITLLLCPQDFKHLHRACKFAEWCMSYGKHQYRTPDRPLSLFEGMGEAIYLNCEYDEYFSVSHYLLGGREFTL